MSGGVVQLVAVGPQDEWLTGKPEVSFYRSNYKKYTHYSNSIERQVIQGTPIANGISTIRFEKKGDLLSYVYFTARDTNGAQIANLDWTRVIDTVELLIGGQVIDIQDIEYMTNIEPITGAQTYSQRYLNNNSSSSNNQKSSFLPLKFFFCKDWSVCLPLIALQYHDVEIRITWSSKLGDTVTSPSSVPGSPKYSQLQYICWTNFVYLDQGERDYFAKAPQHDMLVTQVQRAVLSNNPIQELAFAQPIKFLAFPMVNYSAIYNGGIGSLTASNYTLKTQVNGVDVGDSRHISHFADVPQYYNTPFGFSHNNSIANVAIISYCLDTTKLQPNGTLNFSRLDTFRLVVPPSLTGGVVGLYDTNIGSSYPTPYIYAVSYNVLRIQKGLGSLLYAN